MTRAHGPTVVHGRGRMVLLACAALGGGLTSCGDAGPPDPPPPLGDPVAGLDSGQRGRFLLGRALFERLATADEGLGPLYNAERCSDCHDQPVVGGGGTRVRVVKATRFADGRCDLLVAAGGDNIQRRATDLLVAHGMGPEEVPAAATATSRVTAPPLFGLGLLEAVPDDVLLEWADPDDRDGDGISGRLPRLADGRTARFGRKGDASTVRDFVMTALRFELGFTVPGHTAEEPVNGVPIPPGADPMPDPEIDAPPSRSSPTTSASSRPRRPNRISPRPPATRWRRVRPSSGRSAAHPATARSCTPARPTPRRWPAEPSPPTPTCSCTTWGRRWPTYAGPTPPRANCARRRSGACGTAPCSSMMAGPKTFPPQSRSTGVRRPPRETPSWRCRTKRAARSCAF